MSDLIMIYQLVGNVSISISTLNWTYLIFQKIIFSRNNRATLVSSHGYLE